MAINTDTTIIISDTEGELLEYQAQPTDFMRQAYCVDMNKFYFYDGSNWNRITSETI